MDKGLRKLRKLSGKGWVMASVIGASMMVAGVTLADNLVVVHAADHVSELIQELKEKDAVKEEIAKAKKVEKEAKDFKTNAVEDVTKEIARQNDLNLGVYVVQHGDTLDVVAEAMGESVDKLIEVNHLEKKDLQKYNEDGSLNDEFKDKEDAYSGIDGYIEAGDLLITAGKEKTDQTSTTTATTKNQSKPTSTAHTGTVSHNGYMTTNHTNGGTTTQGHTPSSTTGGEGVTTPDTPAVPATPAVPGDNTPNTPATPNIPAVPGGNIGGNTNAPTDGGNTGGTTNPTDGGNTNTPTNLNDGGNTGGNTNTPTDGGNTGGGTTTPTNPGNGGNTNTPTTPTGETPEEIYKNYKGPIPKHDVTHAQKSDDRVRKSENWKVGDKILAGVKNGKEIYWEIVDMNGENDPTLSDIKAGKNHGDGTMVKFKGEYLSKDGSGEFTRMLPLRSGEKDKFNNGTFLNKNKVTQLVLDRVNDHRKGLGYSPLTINQDLMRLSHMRAYEYGLNGSTRHFDENGKRLTHVRDDNGMKPDTLFENDNRYVDDAAVKFNENLLLSPINSGSWRELDEEYFANMLFDSWKNSPGHENTMRGDDLKYFGFDFNVRNFTRINKDSYDYTSDGFDAIMMVAREDLYAKEGGNTGFTTTTTTGTTTPTATTTSTSGDKPTLQPEIVNDTPLVADTEDTVLEDAVNEDTTNNDVENDTLTNEKVVEVSRDGDKTEKQDKDVNENGLTEGESN